MTTGRIRTSVRLAATGFGVLLVLAGCSTTTDSGSGGGRASATSAAAPAPAPDGASTPPLTLAMASQIIWKQWHGTRLPVTDLWGPEHVSDTVATGFSHSSEGAVLAMVQHQLRLAGLADKDWPSAARQMAVLAPGDQPPVARVSTGFDTTGPLPFVAGFKWISGSRDRAVADLALQNSAGDMRSVRATEVWQNGDWRAELPAGGGHTQPLAGLSDYQPWPGTPR